MHNGTTTSVSVLTEDISMESAEGIAAAGREQFWNTGTWIEFGEFILVEGWSP
jgi:hypothetical protein